VVNLTGTVIHTNLGRALLAEALLAKRPRSSINRPGAQALVAAHDGRAPTTWNTTWPRGGRGDRDSMVEEPAVRR
jgi:seryl-tRNA(Sec) selenium transferase